MAGLIPRQFIDDLIERVDIVEVIDRRVTLKKSGRNYSACCPFHDEKTPSFSVNPDKQFFYCFGCGAGGNSIGFVMDYDNIDFPAAVEVLAGIAGLEVPREEASPEQTRQRQQNQSLYDLLAWTARHFQQQLRQHPQRQQAVDYLKQRGLSGEIARDFGIGYAPPGWDNLLIASAETSGNGGENTRRQQLELAGMLIEKDSGDYYDRFRERVMFPIRDNRGRVIAFGGRVLGDDKPKYLNSPETAVFHKQRELYGLYEARRANRQLDYLLLVEGYMDVVSLVQYGITQAVATLGTASSIFHLEKIFRHTSKLIVCFDGDAAGKKAAQRLLETALPTLRDGREICFLFLPEGEDPDSFVRQQGKPAFLRQLEQATPLESLLFELAAEGVSLDSGAGKAKFSQRCLPLISQLPEGVFQQLILRQLAEKTGADATLLENQCQQIQARHTARGDMQPVVQNKHGATAQTAPQQRAAPAANNATGNTSHTAVHATGTEKTPIVWAIALLLHYPDFAKSVRLPDNLAAVTSAEAQLLRQLIHYIQAQPQRVMTATLLGHWYGTDEAAILNHCANRHQPPEDEAVAQRELQETLDNIARQLEQHKVNQLIAALGQRPSTELNEQAREQLKAISQAKRHKPH